MKEWTPFYLHLFWNYCQLLKEIFYSDSGSTTDEQQLVGGSSSAHLREIGGRSSKRQQTVINMQSHLPTFAGMFYNSCIKVLNNLTKNITK